MNLEVFLDELTKIADLKAGVKLRPHQEDAVNFIIENRGRGLLAHATGSGKTLSSLAAVEKLRAKGRAGKTLVVVPAALQRNFAVQGVQKFTDRSDGPVGSGADYQIISLEKFRTDPSVILEQSRANTIIVDEIHRAKDQSSKLYHALKEVSPEIPNLIGLTGSFISNHPKEIVPLMDIISGGRRHHRLGSQPYFSKMHTVKTPVTAGGDGGFLEKGRFRTTLIRKKPLHEKLKGRLHYLSHEELKDLPGLKVENVHVLMSRQQKKLYDSALGRLSKKHRDLIRKGLPVDQTEAMTILPRLMKARQASNSIGTYAGMSLAQAAEKTPKLKRIMDDVQKHLKETPDGQALIYTNLVESGANELFAGLKARRTTPGLYSGVNKSTRDQDLEDFKSRKKNVMILTPAGGEGISVDDATFFAEVDRHYNPERNQQAIARGRRMGGQAHRASKDRVLQVNRYFSDPPPDFFQRLLKSKDIGVDEWIGMVALEKDILNEEMRRVVQGKK